LLLCRTPRFCRGNQIRTAFPFVALATITWPDFLIDLVFLALPQVPLTLGNAMIAIVEENNKLFPNGPFPSSVSISNSLINLFGASIGGVPMYHGAGGMAGHVRFGARTGRALIILGTFPLGGAGSGPRSSAVNRAGVSSLAPGHVNSGRALPFWGPPRTSLAALRSAPASAGPFGASPTLTRCLRCGQVRRYPGRE
jgi:hypothetical protein